MNGVFLDKKLAAWLENQDSTIVHEAMAELLAGDKRPAEHWLGLDFEQVAGHFFQTSMLAGFETTTTDNDTYISLDPLLKERVEALQDQLELPVSAQGGKPDITAISNALAATSDPEGMAKPVVRPENQQELEFFTEGLDPTIKNRQEKQRVKDENRLIIHHLSGVDEIKVRNALIPIIEAADKAGELEKHRGGTGYLEISYSEMAKEVYGDDYNPNQAQRLGQTLAKISGISIITDKGRTLTSPIMKMSAVGDNDSESSWRIGLTIDYDLWRAEKDKGFILYSQGVFKALVKRLGQRLKPGHLLLLDWVCKQVGHKGRILKSQVSTDRPSARKTLTWAQAEGILKAEHSRSNRRKEIVRAVFGDYGRFGLFEGVAFDRQGVDFAIRVDKLGLADTPNWRRLTAKKTQPP